MKIFLSIIFSLVTIVSFAQPTISLAGKWQVRLDSLDIGETAEWFKKPVTFFGQSIQLPGTLDDAGIGVPDTMQPMLTKEVMQHLRRKVSYIGAAWYASEFSLPQTIDGNQIELFIERVLWSSEVWLDGKKIDGLQESLIAPHNHPLGKVSGGKHVLVVKIDNRKRYDISTGKTHMAHAYTNHTQIIWNGMLGKIQLRSQPAIRVISQQVTTNLAAKKISVQYSFINETQQPWKGSIQIHSGSSNKFKISTTVDAEIPVGKSNLTHEWKPDYPVKGWSEFTPDMYWLSTRLNDHEDTAHFGWRTLTRENARLQINGVPIFLRGTLECAIFPLTGRPPLEVSEWRRIMQIAKSYGLNHLRFHSWCPPHAAFSAADEAGMYLQVELPVWTLTVGELQSTNQFMDSEAAALLKEYGNHPSFCFMSLGNELEGDFAYLQKLVTSLKNKDPRRLYTTTSFTFKKGHGRWPEPADDFFITQYTRNGWVRGQGIFDREAPAFDADYNSVIKGMEVPLISHEIGQYAVYPNLKEIEKYTGILKPTNFVAVRNDLAQKNLLPLADAYTQASGKLATLLYKEEIERALKSTALSGFQLLDLHDFHGQGTALVGVLDAFWESKGFVTADEFKSFSGPAVPLVRMKKSMYENTDTLMAEIEVANFSGASIQQAKTTWTLTNETGNKIASGNLSAKDLPVGNGLRIGAIKYPLKKITKAAKLNLTVAISGTPYNNAWPVWVYPSTLPKVETQIATTLAEAMQRAQKGEKVLLAPAHTQLNGLEGKFVQVFWSPVHFPDQPGTMGLLPNRNHPAFTHFPTENHTNWQWWDLCKQSTTLVLDSSQIPQETIVLRVIDNFFKNRNLAAIIEFNYGAGAILLSAMDITTNLTERPAARQLRYSLLQYLQSSAFKPSASLTTHQLQLLFK